VLPDRVKPPFVIFDTRVKNYKWRLNPVWQHRLLYSCKH